MTTWTQRAVVTVEQAIKVARGFSFAAELSPKERFTWKRETVRLQGVRSRLACRELRYNTFAYLETL